MASMQEERLMKKPLVTIGIPVYNGEKFIRKSIESIFSQTFTDFEIIISDNASTDSTQSICQEYAKSDERITYIRQEKNINMLPNYNFVLNKAKTKYFVWLEYDDFWHPTFLEKNIQILERQNNVIASSGNIEYYGNIEPVVNDDAFVSKFKKLLKRSENINSKFKYVHPINGPYDKKVGFYLRFNRGSAIYAVYRTDVLQKSTIMKPIAAWDLIIILNALKYGDLHVFDEVLMERYSLGASTKGVINEFKQHQISFIDILVPNSTFAIWAAKNLGMKNFLRNLDWFILLTIYGWRTIFLEIIKKCIG